MFACTAAQYSPHAGQLFGPPLMLSNVPGQIAVGGLTVQDGTPIYVSAGVGRERGNVPQLRLGVRSSFGIIDLVSGGGEGPCAASCLGCRCGRF